MNPAIRTDDEAHLHLFAPVRKSEERIRSGQGLRRLNLLANRMHMGHSDKLGCPGQAPGNLGLALPERCGSHLRRRSGNGSGHSGHGQKQERGRDATRPGNQVVLPILRLFHEHNRKPMTTRADSHLVKHQCLMEATSSEGFSSSEMPCTQSATICGLRKVPATHLPLVAVSET